MAKFILTARSLGSAQLTIARRLRLRCSNEKTLDCVDGWLLRFRLGSNRTAADAACATQAFAAGADSAPRSRRACYWPNCVAWRQAADHHARRHRERRSGNGKRQD